LDSVKRRIFTQVEKKLTEPYSNIGQVQQSFSHAGKKTGKAFTHEEKKPGKAFTRLERNTRKPKAGSSEALAYIEKKTGEVFTHVKRKPGEAFTHARRSLYSCKEEARKVFFLLMNRKSLGPLHGERKPAEAIYRTDIKRRQMVENGGSLVMKLGNHPQWGYKYLGSKLQTYTVSYIYMTWQQLSNFTPLSLISWQGFTAL
jgi:hypothetical protein